MQNVLIHSFSQYIKKNLYLCCWLWWSLWIYSIFNISLHVHAPLMGNLLILGIRAKVSLCKHFDCWISMTGGVSPNFFKPWFFPLADRLMFGPRTDHQRITRIFQTHPNHRLSRNQWGSKNSETQRTDRTEGAKDQRSDKGQEKTWA